MLTLDTNAEEVSGDLLGSVEEATGAADREAAETALALVRPKTPRRTGRLSAGLRSVVAPTGGFDLVDDVTYAAVVDARTGFASETIANAEQTFHDIYDRHIQERLNAAT